MNDSDCMSLTFVDEIVLSVEVAGNLLGHLSLVPRGALSEPDEGHPLLLVDEDEAVVGVEGSGGQVDFHSLGRHLSAPVDLKKHHGATAGHFPFLTFIIQTTLVTSPCMVSLLGTEGLILQTQEPSASSNELTLKP